MVDNFVMLLMSFEACAVQTLGAKRVYLCLLRCMKNVAFQVLSIKDELLGYVIRLS